MNEAYRPRRTCLSVPGSSQKMIDKAKDLAADEIFLDLEDAVAPDAKEAARARVAGTLADPGWGRGKLRGVRVNDWTSPWTYADLIEVISAVGASIRRQRSTWWCCPRFPTFAMSGRSICC